MLILALSTGVIILLALVGAYALIYVAAASSKAPKPERSRVTPEQLDAMEAAHRRAQARGVGEDDAHREIRASAGRITFFAFLAVLVRLTACAIDVNPIGHCPPDGGGGGSCAEGDPPDGGAGGGDASEGSP
jgi:hypothetical protein